MLHTQITCLKSFRIGAFFATGLLATFLTLFIFPTANMDDTRATNTLSETTLSMTTSDVVLDFTPTDLNGSFASSTPAEFSVTTNNYSGYSLSIAAAENNANNSKLINGNYYLNSISQASIETDFTNGTWGYKPSLINSQANTNYLPAPSYAGDTLDVTNSANNNNEANTYSIELGMKADFTTPSGAYSNTFVISAIANAVGFQITYDKNTEDTVTNMPESITGDVSATDVFISNTTPQRENYIFMKWYDEDKDLEFQPGDAIDLTQLENTNYFHLKAIWRKVAYLDTGSNVNVKLKKLGGNTGNVYIATTNNTIKEIQMADSLPADFIPSTDNTISLNTSPNPIYAWFDNTDNKGIIYLYANSADIIANAQSSSMFQNISSLVSIDGISNLDTSKVTNADTMFYNTAIVNINALSDWDTSSVTTMRSMFSGASSLTNIDGATNWDTSSVTNMFSMFYGARSLTDIDGAISWDTSNVTSMQQMLQYATSLTNIDGATNWDTSKVTNMNSMFSNAPSLTNIDGATNWDTSSVTDMGIMFYGTKITNIDALATGTRPGNNYVSWNTSSVTTMQQMFYNASSLTNIDGATNWDTSSVTDMGIMFYGTKITNIDALATGTRPGNNYVSWDTSSVTYMNSMFSNAPSLTNIDGATNWNTSNATNMANMFQNTRITNIDALATGTRPGNNYVSWDTSKVINMSGMFSGATSLTNIDGATNWNTSNVTNMGGRTSHYEGMFSGTKITNIDALSTGTRPGNNYVSWDTSSVTYMNNMFSNASSLTNIDGATNWDTSSVTNMQGMFYGTKITNIDALATGTHEGKDYVSWDTSNVTDMSKMFSSIGSLTGISGATNWNTSKVVNMSWMFYGTAITNIDALATGTRPGNNYVSWDTSSVTSMSQMFSTARSLTDISGATNWNTSNVKNMSGMFQDASSLTNIDGATNWDTSSVTNMQSMFSGTKITNINALATGTRPGNDYVSWNTSKVTNMSSMLSHTSSLININGATNWDTSSVTDMGSMFSSATSLTNIDGATNWDTSNVTTMSSMFSYTYSLININGATNWDTSSVTNMGSMFSSASSLTNIDGATNWNTSKVTNMSSMFQNATSITSLQPLDNWDISKVTNMTNIFYGIPDTVPRPNW